MTAVPALLNDNNWVTANQQISQFKQWCTDYYLQLNVEKAKELVFGTSKTPRPGLSPTSIQSKTVKQVDNFKDRALFIDNKPTFDQHTTDIYKQCQQRIHIICKLRALSVAPQLLLLLYKIHQWR